VVWLGWLPSSAGRQKKIAASRVPSASVFASLGQGNPFLPLPLEPPAACRSWCSPRIPGITPCLAYPSAWHSQGLSVRHPKRPWLHARYASPSRRLNRCTTALLAEAMGAVSLRGRGCRTNKSPEYFVLQRRNCAPARFEGISSARTSQNGGVILHLQIIATDHLGVFLREDLRVRRVGIFGASGKTKHKGHQEAGG
jgi:hypothetical protein